MSQKAICPRGHIWDPSTLAGLPPTDRPRCPICGEAEPLRPRHVLGGLRRWLHGNPLLAALSLVCLLLCAAILFTVLRARSETRVAREAAEQAEHEAELARREMLKAKHGLLADPGGAEDRQLARAVEMEAAKWRTQQDELHRQLRETNEWRKEAVRQRDEQARARKQAEELARTADQARQEAVEDRKDTARQLIALHIANGTRLMDGGELTPALLWLAEALRLAHRERLPEEMHRLRLAAVLGHCPRPVQLWNHENKLHAVRLSPDGKLVLTAGADGAVMVREAVSGKRRGEPLGHPAAVQHATFSPDGKRVLTATADKTVHVWDLDAGKEAFPPVQLMGPIVGLNFSPEGRHFLTVTDRDEMAMGQMEPELRIWNTSTGEALAEQALGSDIRPRPAVFSPDGKRVLALCQDNSARIWDITTEKQVGSPFGHAVAVVRARFSPDGARVLTASADGTARLWQTKSAEPACPPLAHGAALRDADFDPDGRHVLTVGADNAVRVWDARTGAAEGPALRHAEAVSRAVFSPDGRFVLTACADGAARLWDYTTGQEALPALHHGRPITDVLLTPSGDKVLTWAGSVVRLWDLSATETPRPPTTHAAAGQSFFSSDGKLELRISAAAVRVYDTATQQTIGGTLPHKNKVRAAAFSADGKYVLTVSHQANGDEQEGHIRVWETVTGRPAGEPLVHPRAVRTAVFSPEGKRVLTACQDRRARLWDVKKGTVIGMPMEHMEDVQRALFLPDGSRILTVDVEGGLRLWEAATAEAIGPTWGHKKPILHLAFSPDGGRLVTADADGTAVVWEAATGRELAATPPQESAMQFAAFSPDGKRLVSLRTDRQARIWDAANGKPLTRPLRHPAELSHAAFSADGRFLLTVAADGVRLWDAASGESLAPVLRPGKGQATIHDAALSKDGRLVLALGTAGDPAGRWTLPFRADERPADDLLHLAELLDGQRLASGGTMMPLEGAELNRQWQALQKKYGSDFAPAAARTAAWHRRGAAECEQRLLWTGAVLHLNHLIAAGEAPDLYARRARAQAALRHWQPAQADYTRALAGEATRWDWWAGRAEVEAAQGHWEQAAADYTKAIEHNGSRAELWTGRGRAEAERGDWKKAADDLGKAIHVGAEDVTVWRQQALALLAAGAESDYRRACGRLVQHFGRGADEAAARSLAWTCGLAADSVRDWRPLIQQAEQAVAAHPQAADDRRRLAVLLYRNGQFESALKQVDEAIRLTGQEAEPRDWLLRALAAQRLGRGEDARKWLDRAEKIHGERKAESWEDRLLYRTLHREAETRKK